MVFDESNKITKTMIDDDREVEITHGKENVDLRNREKVQNPLLGEYRYSSSHHRELILEDTSIGLRLGKVLERRLATQHLF